MRALIISSDQFGEKGTDLLFRWSAAPASTNPPANSRFDVGNEAIATC